MLKGMPLKACECFLGNWNIARDHFYQLNFWKAKLCPGVLCIFLTTLRSYAAVAFYVG
jgi:hypothetical protein